MLRKNAYSLSPHNALDNLTMFHESFLNIKQKMLGNAFGRITLYLRDKLSLAYTAISHSERVGTYANDLLATQLTVNLCIPNRTFIDVGAHIGSIIAEVKNYDPSVKIIAVEAIPEKVEKLRSKFSNIQIHGCAVGDTTGTVSFFINTRESGYSSLALPGNMNSSAFREITVPLRELDELVQNLDVDVIKIDVEGAELGVLRGAVKILNRCHPTIMFESAPEFEGGIGSTKKEIFQFLTEHGYVVLIPNRLAHNDNGMSEEEFVRSHLYPRQTTNYFAVSLERRLEIQNRAFDILH